MNLCFCPNDPNDSNVSDWLRAKDIALPPPSTSSHNQKRNRDVEDQNDYPELLDEEEAAVYQQLKVRQYPILPMFS